MEIAGGTTRIPNAIWIKTSASTAGKIRATYATRCSTRRSARVRITLAGSQWMTLDGCAKKNQHAMSIRRRSALKNVIWAGCQNVLRVLPSTSARATFEGGFKRRRGWLTSPSVTSLIWINLIVCNRCAFQPGPIIYDAGASIRTDNCSCRDS